METAGERFEGRRLKEKSASLLKQGASSTPAPLCSRLMEFYNTPPIPCLRHSVFSLQLSLTCLTLQPDILIIRWHLQPKIGSIQHAIGEDLGKVDTHL
jgi:hypothetical protein